MTEVILTAAQYNDLMLSINLIASFQKTVQYIIAIQLMFIVALVGVLAWKN